MEPARFDAVARALVAPPTRRGVLKALVGAVLRGLPGARGARVAAGCTDIGASCAAASECCQLITPTHGTTQPACTSVGPKQGGTAVCPQGGRVCCIPRGRPCGRDCQCCGTDACIDGFCQPDCKAPRATCTATTECCQAGGRTVCGDNAHSSPPGQPITCPRSIAKHCCRPRHGACAVDCDCCDGLPCTNGFCGGPCKRIRQSCDSSANCCQSAATPLRCVSSGPKRRGTVVCAQGGPVCCLSLGRSCTGDCDCCGSNECRVERDDFGTPTGRGKVCHCPSAQRLCGGACIPASRCCPDDAPCSGGPCTRCREGFACENGVCVCPAGSAVCNDGNCCPPANCYGADPNINPSCHRRPL